MAKVTDIVKTYILNQSSDNVKLSLEIGALGQTGASRVTLENVILLWSHPGNLDNLIIGQNGDLHKKKLNVITIITDTSAESDDTNLRITLKGGIDEESYDMEKEVQSGGSQVYTAEITFFALT